jgi:5-keto-L-gluconate epimerase
MHRWPLGMIVPLQDPTPFSPFRPQDWKGALDAVATAGFDGVELAVTAPALLQERDVAEALETLDLHLLSITTGQAASIEGLSLSSRDHACRKRAIERICSHMTFARAFPNSPVVIVGSLRGRDGDLMLLRESLKECAQYDSEIQLALEPLNRYESQLLNTVEQTLELIEVIRAPNIGVLFDTFHANIEEPSLSAAIETAEHRLVHVHLADSNRWVPGHGHLDFESVWRALERIEYPRACVLEPMLKPDASTLLGFARSPQAQPR